MEALHEVNRSRAAGAHERKLSCWRPPIFNHKMLKNSQAGACERLRLTRSYLDENCGSSYELKTGWSGEAAKIAGPFFVHEPKLKHWNETP